MIPQHRGRDGREIEAREYHTGKRRDRSAWAVVGLCLIAGLIVWGLS